MNEKIRTISVETARLEQALWERGLRPAETRELLAALNAAIDGAFDAASSQKIQKAKSDERCEVHTFVSRDVCGCSSNEAGWEDDGGR